MPTPDVMYWPYKEEPTFEKRIFLLAKRMHETYDDGPQRMPPLLFDQFADEMKELFRLHGWNNQCCDREPCKECKRP